MTNAENGAAPAAAADAKTVPALNVIAQYVKDLSVENPNAPASLQTQAKSPDISVNVNVNAKPMAEKDFEVSLSLTAKATGGETLLFSIELDYCGIFRIVNVPKENTLPMVMIECPRLLFPFARQILADVSRQAGFPPLYIDPVDFAALYRNRLQQMQEAQKQAETEGTSTEQ
jgi:preprotein translocase subunit SecB